MFKGLKYSLCRAQWAPVGLWVCSEQQQGWEPVPGCPPAGSAVLTAGTHLGDF